MRKPLVSVIVPTKNSEKFLEKCLKSIKNQTYQNIEIIIVDGGSTDNTKKIAENYHSIIINNHLVFAEPGVYLGMKKAHGELIMILAVDNFFEDNHAIEKIIGIFKDPNVYAAFPKHDSEKSYSIFSKYINTFTDPFNHFLYGYAANARTFKNIYKTIRHNEIYDICDFKSTSVKPMLALAQGFTVRKDFINLREDKFDDITPILLMIKQNKEIAYIHSISIYHQTISTISRFIRKQRWATKNALEGKKYGIAYRMGMLSKWQKIKIYLYFPYAFSLMLPFIRSIYRSLKDKEKIWLFHSAITFISAVAIMYEFIIIKLGITKNISRQ
jgi:glycosyltransferase involved in cell wall biosynthesis